MGLIMVFRRVEHPRWLTEPLHGQTVYQDYKISMLSTAVADVLLLLFFSFVSYI